MTFWLTYLNAWALVRISGEMSYTCPGPFLQPDAGHWWYSETERKHGLKILAQNTAPLYVHFAMLFGKLALSKTSQLAPNTGLRLGSWTPSKLSLRRHSSSLCVSSVGQAWVRARSCSSDSELWTPKEHNWSCASASLQLETIEAFTQRCWLWHSDAMGQSQRFDDVGWFEVNGKQMTTVKKKKKSASTC